MILGLILALSIAGGSMTLDVPEIETRLIVDQEPLAHVMRLSSDLDQRDGFMVASASAGSQFWGYVLDSQSQTQWHKIRIQTNRDSLLWQPSWSLALTNENNVTLTGTIILATGCNLGSSSPGDFPMSRCRTLELSGPVPLESIITPTHQGDVIGGYVGVPIGFGSVAGMTIDGRYP